MKFLAKVEAEITPSKLQDAINWIERSIKSAERLHEDLLLETTSEGFRAALHVDLETMLDALNQELMRKQPRIKVTQEFLEKLVSSLPDTMQKRFVQGIESHFTSSFLAQFPKKLRHRNEIQE